MKYNQFKWNVLCFVIGMAFLSFFSSCNKDKLDKEELEPCEDTPTSYNLNIQPIIEANCSYSGCHDGSSPGIFTSYTEMLTDLDDGDIVERAIELRDMPPSYASGPKELTEEEYDLLSCWLAAGYPEN